MNKFYMVLGKDTNYVIGRRWVNGTWLSEETISNGLASAFTVFPDVAADSTGALYCAWEYWGSGKPQQYYSRMTSLQVIATPLWFSRAVPMGGTLSDDTFIVTNGGPGTMSYTIGTDVGWLSTLPTAGSANFTQDNAVAVRYNPAGLNPGAYTGHVIVTAPGASGSPKSISVTLNGTPIQPDFDSDGDVDLEDFALFQICFAGPNRPPQRPGCSGPDLDSDGDVDLEDFASFQGCFNGPNRTPGCQ